MTGYTMGSMENRPAGRLLSPGASPVRSWEVPGWIYRMASAEPQWPSDAEEDYCHHANSQDHYRPYSTKRKHHHVSTAL